MRTSNKTPKAYVPKHARLWTRSSNYSGRDLSDYYMGLSQCRDSDLLTRCNFSAMLDALGGEQDDKVEVARFGCWANGWSELILVHKDAYKTLTKLDELYASLKDYCILDEDSFHALEQEEQEDTLRQFNSDFRREVFKYIGREADEAEDYKQLDSFLEAVYQEDCGYQGTEDAWVGAGSIERFCTSYEFSQYKRNHYAASCLKAMREQAKAKAKAKATETLLPAGGAK